MKNAEMLPSKSKYIGKNAATKLHAVIFPVDIEFFTCILYIYKCQLNQKTVAQKERK